MTTTQMNAEIYRAMSVIAEDEGLLKQALKYLKKLAAKKEDDALMTKDDFFKRVDEAKKGPIYELAPGESMDDLIKRVL